MTPPRVTASHACDSRHNSGRSLGLKKDDAMGHGAHTSEPDLIHKLKNYICIISGFSELLISESPDDDPRRADLVEIHKAAQAAMAIMPDLAERVR